MFSLTAEYALRAMVNLAALENGAVSQTVGQIAEGTRVPAGYLAKVLQTLSRSGLIVSQRGLGGGFRLAKSAAGTSILEVLQAVDPIDRIRKCPLGLETHTHLCPLHQRLDDAMALIEEQFRATSIADLLEKPLSDDASPAEPCCSFPLPPSANGSAD